jgi:hypothetical protein
MTPVILVIAFVVALALHLSGRKKAAALVALIGAKGLWPILKEGKR